MKKKLREFVKASWKPTHDNDDASFNAEARILALNFLDFLSEARGYLVIHFMTPLRFLYYTKVWFPVFPCMQYF